MKERTLSLLATRISQALLVTAKAVTLIVLTGLSSCTVDRSIHEIEPAPGNEEPLSEVDTSSAHINLSVRLRALIPEDVNQIQVAHQRGLASFTFLRLTVREPGEEAYQHQLDRSGLKFGPLGDAAVAFDEFDSEGRWLSWWNPREVQSPKVFIAFATSDTGRPIAVRYILGRNTEGDLVVYFIESEG